MKLELVHADTCLPDYWGGHHKAHISVPVHHGMKLGELKRLLLDEMRCGYVCGSDDLAFLLNADYVSAERESDAIKATKAAYAAIRRLKLADKRKRKLFTDLEKVVDEYEDSVYAYFVFTEL